VAELATELTSLQQEALQLRSQASRMEGVVRATGERAAAAEDAVSTKGDSVASLQQQLAQLQEKWVPPWLRGALARARAKRGGGCQQGCGARWPGHVPRVGGGVPAELRGPLTRV
jgi:hypothetical protein